METLTNYISAKYCAIGNDTMQQQMEDYLFIVHETSAYLLGNALALLTPDSQDKEIQTFSENLRRIIALQMKKAGESELPPS